MGNPFVSTELVSKAVLSASSNSNSIYRIRDTAPNNQMNLNTIWTSDGACHNNWIAADWSSQGGYSISSFAIMNGPNPAGAPMSLVLQYTSGYTNDVTSNVNCVKGQINDNGGGNGTIEWDVCSFNTMIPDGTLDNVAGATFTFAPSSGGNCVIGIHEVRISSRTRLFSYSHLISHQLEMWGVPTPGISAGAIAGIVLAVLAIVLAAGVCVVRQYNLRKREKAHRWTSAGVDPSEWVSEALVQSSRG
ncbi:hypothetical protein BC830DRAFT_1130986 [Chytriomyces sp. MP71]|nr:hypothetical protein BC830DRAFT_1130986 [Chytriomyces sp. MP71]